MKRGDVYLADLDPTNLTVVVVPFTTNLKMQNLPTCVLVPAGEGGLRVDSVAIGHQIRALDKRGLVAHWGTLSPARLAEIERAILRTLGVSLRP
jgi:mRNA interferase MazF